ncbi:single-stranded-DNA-specific exonuclease RecJ [Acuticoccus mangrovi]|uniref:Single-stranded-DNA-specific exonuclease RecJ n=1 Tax=Acuticoccus mangrovi TaxID=2796142 RepID=A0A934IPW1_9HYPH|nr:single-stranded-DNA-specific exonuclease RecJ [Acuticoccus mangrovi]MBJ3776540.1 single-stranded-DNA-specific exonuclease RecJ [Acuticoccus mangrovi]
MSQSLSTAPAPDPVPLLGVARSVSGRRWLRRLDVAGERTATALAQRHTLSDIAARVLAGRGVTLENAATELAPKIRDLLPDPSRLTDGDAVATRLADAVERGERIVLFADYDVDGATSAALVSRTLAALGAACRIVIPDRITDGYGPSVAAMHEIADAGADLVVCLDCGAGAIEPVAAAKERGLDLLVIDHHPVDALAPADAIVNPNRPDDLSGLGDLAAVGVAFVAMVGLVREMRRRGRFAASPEPNLLALLDCVALGTVADVVPLTPLNRAFVATGLTAMARRTNPGLSALATVSRLGGPIDATHLGYVLGPRINAGGRIGDSRLGARLLTSEDPAETERIAELLDRLNRERRALETDALAEAEAMADPDAPLIVVAGTWHKGVVGLVAARLKERYRRPAIAIALEADAGTGSARSIRGVDIGAAIREAAADGLLIKGGGHAMAAGLTVAPERIARLVDRLTDRLAGEIAAARAADSLKIDAIASPGAIDETLARALSALGPWGAGRPKPVLALEGVTVDSAVPVGAAGDSLRLRLGALGGASVEAMAFRANGPIGERLRRRGTAVHVAVEVSHGSFRGVPRAEVCVVDVADAAAAMSRAA